MQQGNPPPFVGAIVHRKWPVGCAPGIVTAVHPDGSVDMNCFGPTGAVPHIRLPQGDQAGAWHYPCDAPPTLFLRRDMTDAEMARVEAELNEAMSRHPSRARVIPE